MGPARHAGPEHRKHESGPEQVVDHDFDDGPGNHPIEFGTHDGISFDRSHHRDPLAREPRIKTEFTLRIDDLKTDHARLEYRHWRAAASLPGIEYKVCGTDNLDRRRLNAQLIAEPELLQMS